MNKLADKVAVITGGNSGMGLATAKLFAQQGAHVAITGRSQTTINQAVQAIGSDTVGFVSDVTDVAALGSAYESISQQVGKIDILVVNAGIFAGAPLEYFSETLFDELSDVLFKGAFFSVQKALPYLNDGASVILTSSSINEKGQAYASVYLAAKAAVRSLARSFSAELLNRQIRVNVLSPGAIDTPMFDRGGLSASEVDGLKAHTTSTVPVKRMGTVNEIAQGYLFLASDESSYMVGAELVIDGGLKSL